ncbi:bifunctional hydroxymethylpyrimidine kinase/phosphomethylpyrimidine kinase [Maricaulis sp.]|jgi:hydroxymethylpyrimidine/phosphomethylpyrimidine kinase|uniref:bifunctional hydroxymethylpyrimidine kinase/phosphomethylpyrimidine kinase n=1 Tax=Maricaulis sp. TaxID=1486257 RepID=UPI0025D16497|nr:bifunctional hydroxymethylpyrimidine kinase/phosphomethylpyrimidine kinase [Maricaulis sp.]MDF1768381.1 bifunctional hydroxymethylpyrimidine kinase/phosphomethylpyrimidine kinase [Maricaulis sp.]
MDISEPKGRVLVIAGSDSGGGAGIQADIKAITAMGGFAATAVTAITVQNTLGVTAIHPVPLDVLRGQIDAVLDDIGADVIKTGMLGNADVVTLVADRLQACEPPVPLVLDPVMVATSGDALVDDGTETAIRDRLLPLAFLVTPNIPEAEKLTGLVVEDISGQLDAANRLVEMGARAALVKGGHLKGNVVTDVLVSARGMELMERPRLPGRNTHGTGCTLASAIAALLADGAALPDAVRRAGDYLHEAIARAPGFGAGHGPVNHAWVMRP